jgi:DNA polymerase III delta prime subunit
MFKEHLDKNNLHHAYLIEGSREIILPEVLNFLEDIDVKISSNPDFYNVFIDTFKVKDAEDIKSLSNQKIFEEGEKFKKIFIISTNNFLLEAQNSLLKIFEEPNKNTHFFIIVPDVSIFIPTIVSRFRVIYTKDKNTEYIKIAESFITMKLSARIEFIKDFVKEKDEEVLEDSTRAKANRFLDALEAVLHKKNLSKTNSEIFNHIFNVRQFLRQPGSSTKMLLESVALVVPIF